MPDETEAEKEAPKQSSRMGLMIGLVLALIGGGGSFFAVYTGIILAPPYEEAGDTHKPAKAQVASFVPIEPLIVSLGTNAELRLRFRAELEVDPSHQSDVQHMMPRILDILNGYLRAVEVSELRDPTALIRLRAQMLRRVQLVTGKGSVRDLLITEFVFG